MLAKPAIFLGTIDDNSEKPHRKWHAADYQVRRTLQLPECWSTSSLVLPLKCRG
jgi:hypothetical protein